MLGIVLKSGRRADAQPAVLPPSCGLQVEIGALQRDKASLDRLLQERQAEISETQTRLQAAVVRAGRPASTRALGRVGLRGAELHGGSLGPCWPGAEYGTRVSLPTGVQSRSPAPTAPMVG